MKLVPKLNFAKPGTEHQRLRQLNALMSHQPQVNLKYKICVTGF